MHFDWQKCVKKNLFGECKQTEMVRMAYDRKDDVQWKQFMSMSFVLMVDPRLKLTP